MSINNPSVGGSWNLLIEKTLTATGSLSVSNIPPGYSKLHLILNLVNSGASGDQFSLQFNGDTGTNYNFQSWQMHSSASGGGSSTNRTSGDIYGWYNVNEPTLITVDIMNIASTQKQYNAYGGSIGTVSISGGNWTNTSSQITSISIITLNGGYNSLFLTGSKISVYGDI